VEERTICQISNHLFGRKATTRFVR